MYYLDANATTFMPDIVVRAMVKWTNKGNPSANYGSANECRDLMEVFRKSILQDNRLTNHTILFTSGASESNSHILTSTVRSFMRKTGHLPHVIISSIEHKSIQLCCENLKNDGLCDYTKISVRTDKDKFGTIDPADLEQAIRPNTCLISIMTANNETGIINDIPALTGVAHKYKIPFHTDCVQSFGKFGVYNEVDACSVSFHKFYGPPGLGLLIIRTNFIQGYDLKAMITGTQNNGLRGGTENMPAIGAAYAAYKYNLVGRNDKNNYLLSMKQLLKRTLNNYIPCYYFDEFEQQRHTKNKIFWISNRDEVKMIPNTLLIAVYKDKFCNIRMKEELEKKNIIVGLGSACNTSAAKLSDVVSSLQIPIELIGGILRISLTDDVTNQHIIHFVTHFINLQDSVHMSETTASP